MFASEYIEMSGLSRYAAELGTQLARFGNRFFTHNLQFSDSISIIPNFSKLQSNVLLGSKNPL
jgi:hypothetical protein